jgi:hypothetical protein
MRVSILLFSSYSQIPSATLLFIIGLLTAILPALSVPAHMNSRAVASNFRKCQIKVSANTDIPDILLETEREALWPETQCRICKKVRNYFTCS